MDWVLTPVEVVDPFSLPTPVLISFLEENINISEHSLRQLRRINVLDVWQHLTGLRIRNLVKVVEDCLPLSLDDGVDDCLDCPHGGVITLLLPVRCRITHLRYQ